MRWNKNKRASVHPTFLLLLKIENYEVQEDHFIYYSSQNSRGFSCFLIKLVSTIMGIYGILEHVVNRLPRKLHKQAIHYILYFVFANEE